MAKRKWLIWVILAVLVVAGYFGYRALQNRAAAAAQNYQTVAARVGKLTAIVGATGTVRANQSTVMSWQTSGRIESISAEVGEQVKPGDELARLVKTSLPQSVILAEADLVTAQRNLETVQSSELSRAQAQLTLAQARVALTNAQETRDSKKYARVSDATIDVARANLLLAQDRLEKAQDAFDQVKHLEETNPIYANALSALGSAQQNYDRAEANLNYLLGGPDADEVSEADAQLMLAEARLADAEREWERLKDGADPQDISSAQARVDAILATINMSHLEAPFAGTITEVRSMVGDQVSPGTASFRIDDLTHLLVDVDVPEVDINSIQIGQKATMSFDALQAKEYTGQVTKVARIGTETQGVVNFTVTIELLDADASVLPGMTAAVNIVVNEIDNTLLVPNRAVRLREGDRVVYVLRAGVLTPTKVSIGASSDVESQILEGDVKNGDLLVLNPPVEFTQGGGMPMMR